MFYVLQNLKYRVHCFKTLQTRSVSKTIFKSYLIPLITPYNSNLVRNLF
jgi:hypothetical protein